MFAYAETQEDCNEVIKVNMTQLCVFYQAFNLIFAYTDTQAECHEAIKIIMTQKMCVSSSI